MHNDTLMQLGLYPGMLPSVKPRLDQTLPIGNEGAGDILATMEAVGSKNATGFNTDNKQLPILSGEERRRGVWLVVDAFSGQVKACKSG